MEIKPCPFCGAIGRVITPEDWISGPWKYQVKCCNPICKMSYVITPVEKDRIIAIEKWNIRK